MVFAYLLHSANDQEQIQLLRDITANLKPVQFTHTTPTINTAFALHLHGRCILFACSQMLRFATFLKAMANNQRAVWLLPKLWHLASQFA